MVHQNYASGRAAYPTGSALPCPVVYRRILGNTKPTQSSRIHVGFRTVTVEDRSTARATGHPTSPGEGILVGVDGIGPSLHVHIHARDAFLHN